MDLHVGKLVECFLGTERYTAMTTVVAGLPDVRKGRTRTLWKALGLYYMLPKAQPQTPSLRLPP